ncbi:MAG: osmotically inducible protein OsmC [Methylotenera sp.]|jgi:putative redox protein|nr:MAG: osmotically inducible protein OsmC [Methylotenera sp.]
MNTSTVLINTQAGVKLSARIDTPDGAYRATALFAHCFTCGKDILAASRISRRLVALGFAVLRFDFAGIGASEGEFSDTNFSSNVQDLIEATQWLKVNFQAPSLMIGHSLGGTAIIAASGRIPEAQAYVTIGSPSDPRHIFNLIGSNNLHIIEQVGEAEVSLEGRPFLIKRQFLEDLTNQQLLKQIRSLHKPLLIMHAPEDQTVPIDHATTMFHAASHPKSFLSLGSADHLITNKVDAEFIADVIASWSGRYIK